MEKRPKRRKSKDNPYTLKFNDFENNYIVEFSDSKNEIHSINVSQRVYQAFDKFELEDISVMHKTDKHIDFRSVEELELTNILFYETSNNKDLVEEKVDKDILYESLYNAINSLNKTQKRRIKMYYFEGKTLQEIADIEGVHFTSVRESILSGIKKLQKLLK